jgi:hypothetical protein
MADVQLKINQIITSTVLSVPWTPPELHVEDGSWMKLVNLSLMHW